MANVTQFNVTDIVVDLFADLPSPQSIVAQGTLAFVKVSGNLFVLVIDPITNIHTWQPVTSFGILSPVNYKFAGSISVSDTLAHTLSLADDGEANAQDGAPLVYRVVTSTKNLRIRANVTANTSSTAAHLNVYRNGSLVSTILIPAGATGGFGIDATQAFDDGNGLEVTLVKDAGGNGGAQVISITVDLLLYS